MTNSRPSRVDDIKKYWGKLPKELSPRCQWWAQQIKVGWKPNRRISMMGYYESAEWFGVYIQEYLSVLYPMIHCDRNESVKA